MFGENAADREFKLFASCGWARSFPILTGLEKRGRAPRRKGKSRLNPKELRMFGPLVLEYDSDCPLGILTTQCGDILTAIVIDEAVRLAWICGFIVAVRRVNLSESNVFGSDRDVEFTWLEIEVRVVADFDCITCELKKPLSEFINRAVKSKNNDVLEIPVAREQLHLDSQSGQIVCRRWTNGILKRQIPLVL